MICSNWFSRREFRCKGEDCDGQGNNCGFDAVDAELLNVLELVRNHFGRPVTITSGCRCISHNHQVGGAPKSKHTRGIAADIKVAETEPEVIYNYLDRIYPDTYGIGLYSAWVHIDVRGEKARWDS